MAVTTPWFAATDSPTAVARLVCFPHAGGGVQAYRDWRRQLPPFVELTPVQLPGRDRRRDEPMPRSLVDLARPVAHALAELSDLPLCLFGHSFGALTAFETARALRQIGGPTPVGLVVSGRVAPQLPYSGPDPSATDDRLVEAVLAYGGTPPEVAAEPDLLRLMVPVLRDDLTLLAGYRHRPQPPLSCPMLVLGGDRDPLTPSAGLAAWDVHTTSSCDVNILPGGHFFLHEGTQAVPPLMSWILDLLARHH